MSDGVLVGLDVGGTKILGVAIERGATTSPLGQARRPTIDDRQRLVRDLAELAREVAGGRRIDAVGIGLPGFIDAQGIARQAPHLRSVVGVDIGRAVGAELGVAVCVENDANCAAWLAYVEDAPDASSVVAITLGTGIGGGIIADGELVRGAHGFAGEPGHMMVDPEGPICDCGLRGCWELWASGTGLGRLALRAASVGELPEIVDRVGSAEAVTGQVVMAGLIDTDDVIAAECRLVLGRYAHWVAIGTVNLINLLDPDCIIFSGGIVEHGDTLIDAIRSAVDAFPTMHDGRSPDLRLSRAGPLSGALGAALLAGVFVGVR